MFAISVASAHGLFVARRAFKSAVEVVFAELSQDDGDFLLAGQVLIARPCARPLRLLDNELLLGTSASAVSAVGASMVI